MENQEEKKFKMPTVPLDTLITIEISGAYLKRCQLLLMILAKDMGEELVKQCLERFKATDEVPDTIRESVFYILMSLVAEAEKAAIDQKKVVDTELTKEEIANMFGKASGN